MLQERVKDFLDAAKFGPPQIAHIVEALVNSVKTGVHGSELRVHECYHKPD